ncbi:hypothetical protein [Pseudovibrio sp. Tun.PSC04-5.I4]|uniref:hypothetical protein n=1 Tax=Pseudovibrio sp. Tun.PSC04-5.I4 TaxID=1798213 RepID=UPI00088B9D3D|nr:hypothetical protein [Pseudovibrio sp. Tun.PSC04-5.I4]SDQ20804.1 hypothetical protein SAMN04515695_0480 [Pseudovibrio sp. Tun.PSC04-5.I4]
MKKKYLVAIALVLFVGFFIRLPEEPKECKPNLTDLELRQVLLAEMKARSMDVAKLFPPDGSSLNVGEMTVRPADHDPSDYSNSECNLARHEVQFAYSNFEFWALIDGCGNALMAGRGRYRY